MGIAYTICTMTVSIGERVYDITFWKTELNAEITAMEVESDNLQVPIATTRSFVALTHLPSSSCRELQLLVLTLIAAIIVQLI